MKKRKVKKRNRQEGVDGGLQKKTKIIPPAEGLPVLC